MHLGGFDLIDLRSTYKMRHLISPLNYTFRKNPLQLSFCQKSPKVVNHITHLHLANASVMKGA